MGWLSSGGFPLDQENTHKPSAAIKGRRQNLEPQNRRKLLNGSTTVSDWPNGRTVVSFFKVVLLLLRFCLALKAATICRPLDHAITQISA